MDNQIQEAMEEGMPATEGITLIVLMGSNHHIIRHHPNHNTEDTHSRLFTLHKIRTQVAQCIKARDQCTVGGWATIQTCIIQGQLTPTDPIDLYFILFINSLYVHQH